MYKECKFKRNEQKSEKERETKVATSLNITQPSSSYCRVVINDATQHLLLLVKYTLFLAFSFAALLYSLSLSLSLSLILWPM